MTRLKIAITILVISITLSIASLTFITTTCARLVDTLDEIIVDIGKRNSVKAAESLQNAIDYFEKIKPVLNLLEGQGETIEIRGDLNKAIFFYNATDYESCVLHLEECKTDLNRIIVSNLPSISTIL
ncbi:MAG: DUF4363 family protein [Clostridia bacterium]|nr:DUF4363 family protein [Clostridia bacterium]